KNKKKEKERMGNHKVIFKTFVDAVLKRMRTAAKDDIFDWKKLGFAGAEKVANRLQAQVTENEDQTQFSVSCKEFRHEFKVEDTNFHYTREDESGKRKFQLKQFDELRAEFLKMKMEAAHLESMQGELELRRQEKALAELKWRETLRRDSTKSILEEGGPSRRPRRPEQRGPSQSPPGQPRRGHRRRRPRRRRPERRRKRRRRPERRRKRRRRPERRRKTRRRPERRRKTRMKSCRGQRRRRRRHHRTQTPSE
ncbi:hypothetical protein BRARA_D02793, partial [Brassica rapa]